MILAVGHPSCGEGVNAMVQIGIVGPLVLVTMGSHIADVVV